MASEKEPQKTATLIEEVSRNGQAVDVLDLDARIQQMASECSPFYKNRNLLILYLLVSALSVLPWLGWPLLACPGGEKLLQLTWRKGIPGCLVPSLTLGFDGAMMNGR